MNRNEVLSIETIGIDAEEEINTYLLKHRASLLYSSPSFMKLVTRHIQAQGGWFVAKRGDEIAGFLPFIVKDGPLGTVYNSMAYYGSNGGVIQHEYDDLAKTLLIEKFYETAKKNNALSATIITNPLLEDSDFYKKHIEFTHIDERIGQITRLPKDETELSLMKMFDDPRPRNIRKAQRMGVVIERKREHDALSFLYDSHALNMGAIGGLSKRRDFFDLIPQVMKDNEWDIYIAKLEGRPVAALLLFYYNLTVEYFTPVILEQFRNTQALALIIYQAMVDAQSNGFENWNWGGTWLTQGGVYDFKKRWGTTDYPYYYFNKVFNQSVYTSSKADLLREYEGVYVLPFSELESKPMVSGGIV
ncbi:MAG: GNAT family N-acetyltransferase [Alphaproteobacteria bacterium]